MLRPRCLDLNIENSESDSGSSKAPCHAGPMGAVQYHYGLEGQFRNFNNRVEQNGEPPKSREHLT